MIPDHILWQDRYCDWGPLERVLTYEECGHWMWMHAVDAVNGERVHFYKHIETRRYLRLDGRGHLYAEDADGHPLLIGP
jgi:hypothetical protein